MPNHSVIFITFLILLFSVTGSMAAEEVIDSICAVVDEAIILESEVTYGINSLLLEYGIRAPTDEQIAGLRRQVLESYIIQKVLLAQADEETLFVEDRLIDQELDRKFAQMTRQVGSERQLAEYFGRPLPQIKREMRQNTEDGLRIERLKQQHIAPIYVRRPEVIYYYREFIDQLPKRPEQVKLSHIQIAITPSDDARLTAVERIDEIYGLLTEGADFDSLARTVSDDPSGENGGHLGWTNRNDLVPEYESVAYELEPGAISEIVESRYGFHIIKLIERQGERISTQHILIKLSAIEEDRERSRLLAEQIVQQLDDDEDFAELARLFSNDEETASTGGVLIPMVFNELVPELQGVVAPLSVGEHSDPFETPFGWEIFRLDDRVPERVLSLTEDWTVIEQFALRMKQERMFLEWVESLKQDHYIHPESERQEE